MLRHQSDWRGGSDTRKRADIVFHSIIEPALTKCNLHPVRSDQIDEPGLISSEMYRRILGDEICIVVLTDWNPNVFYELAIAHAAARPVVSLIEQGQKPPFDIQDHRHVEYDPTDEAALQKAADIVVKHVTALVQSTASPSVPFNSALSPLGATVGWRMAGRPQQAALRRVLGKDALGEQGIAVTVPVYEPLVRDNFQGAAQVTIARKTDESRNKVQRPIYGDVLRFRRLPWGTGNPGAARRAGGAQRQAATQLGISRALERQPLRRLPGLPLRQRCTRRAGDLSTDVGGAWITGNRDDDDAGHVSRRHRKAAASRASCRPDACSRRDRAASEPRVAGECGDRDLGLPRKFHLCDSAFFPSLVHDLRGR